MMANRDEGDVSGSSSSIPVNINVSQAQLRQMSRVRDQIANQLWESVQH